MTAEMDIDRALAVLNFEVARRPDSELAVAIGVVAENFSRSIASVAITREEAVMALARARSGSRGAAERFVTELVQRLRKSESPNELERSVRIFGDRMKSMLTYIGGIHGDAATALQALRVGDIRGAERFLAKLTMDQARERIN